jgi:catalase
MRFDGNSAAAPNCEPTSQAGGLREDARDIERRFAVSSEMGRYGQAEGADDFEQAGNLFRLMSPEQQKLLIGNIVGAMSSVPRETQERQLATSSVPTRPTAQALRAGSVSMLKRP